MSDFNSSLPVRTQNNGDIAAKIVDGTTTSQALAVDSSGRITTKMDDGAGNAITSQVNGSQQALDVGINVAGVQIDPRSIRALTSSDVVSVVQSTSPWVTSDLADGSSTGGTAGTKSALAGGIYNTALPTLTNGQQAGLQLNSSGELLVASVSANDTNYGTVGANTLRTAAQIGNATGAADFNAGATGAQTLRTAANQGAPNTTANAWPTKLTDGTNTASVTAAGELKVDITQPLPTGTNTIGSVNQGTSPWVTSVNNLPTTVDTNYGTVGSSTIRVAAEPGNASGIADFNNGATSAQTLRVAANLAVAGANVSSTNPIPVSITSALVGTSVNNYNTAAAIAAGGTSNHTYTITSSKTFNGKKIWASASGKLKIEVQVSPDGSTYSSLWVGFNSTATPNIAVDLDELVFLESGTGSTIRIIRTNLDLLSMDVYSTISGTEV